MSEPTRYLLLIFATIFLAAGVYIFQPISAGVEAFSKTTPCSQPLSYTIGNIDTRFSITEDELKEAVEKAAGVWNSGTETILLKAREDEPLEDDITIQMVYDDRQERTDREVRFRERIKSQQIRLDNQQINHDKKRDLFDQRSEEYQVFAENTSDQLGELNEWVTEKNDNGGFTGTEFEQFKQRKKEVEEAQEKVRIKQQELDDLARSINTEMDEINKKFEVHNKLIDQYNEEFAGDLRFAKATYQRTSAGGVVTVNQFMNEKELILILAHELGHALGVSHLNQPKAVMYSLMGGQQINPVVQLTQSDIKAVMQLCN